MISEIYKKPFPHLVISKEYALREQSLSDAEPFFNYYSKDPLVTQYILASVPNTVEEASSEISYCRNLFHHKRGIYWSLVRQDTNQIIGAVGLYINNHHHRAEICYDLAQAYWRQGIMGQALRQVIDFTFRETEMHRIEALVLEENTASKASLKKMGFIHEGTLHNYRYFKNEPRDVELYATTREMQAKS